MGIGYLSSLYMALRRLALCFFIAVKLFSLSGGLHLRSFLNI